MQVRYKKFGRKIRFVIGKVQGSWHKSKYEAQREMVECFTAIINEIKKLKNEKSR